MKKFNKSVLIIPVVIVVVLAALISIFPKAATTVISSTRNFLGNDMGVYYILFGIAAIILLLFLAFSKIGKIKLGKPEDKKMNTFTWGALIFTSTMAADILFYSFHEWTYYWNADIGDVANITTESSRALWSSTYSLFHWGFIPWSFYLILAVIYGFVFHNINKRNKQTMADMCEPLLKRQTNKALGKTINIISIVGLLCGTSTTFSVATPLIAAIACKLFGIANTPLVSVIILIIVAAIYTAAVLAGSKGITLVGKITTIVFSFLLALFLIIGGPRFIIENGVQGLGNMLANFIKLSTWTEATRTSTFVQDWTIFYWAYWIAWCVATPFFIAKISKGRTIKNVLLGGMLCGLLGTFASFIIFGGFGINLQVNGTFDAVSLIESGAAPAEVIVEMISTNKLAVILLPLILITMICLYSSTFDALTSVVSSFSYKELDIDASPSKKVKIFWSVAFIALPIALIFLDETNQLLMSMSIIGAFPLTIIMILIVISFFKYVKQYKQSDVWKRSSKDE